MASFDLGRIAASGLVAEIDHHDLLGSTNDRALELAARGEHKLPLLVLADVQTAGRGRGVNRWWAGAGALTFSLVQDAAGASLASARWPQQSLVVGLAVCEAMAELAPRGDWRVKWPNDVFLNGGKVGGILCESVPGWADRLIVGIGLNVNNSLAAAPREIQLSGRALIDLDGISRDLSSVLVAILDKLDERWTQFRAAEFAPLASAYRDRCFLTAKTLTVSSAGQACVGLCRGIDDSGFLRLQTENGLHALVSGTIERWE